MKGATVTNEAAMTKPHRPYKEGVNQAFLRLAYAPGEARPVERWADQGVTNEEPKTNTEIVLEFLNEALATEIICILRYKRHYFMTAGISARRVKTTLLQHVAEKQAHADQLAERIVQLGGSAVLPFERLLNRSYAEQIEGESLAEMITANLLAERSAIHNYRAMIAAIGADDPTTRFVLERILAQEEAHAENLASLLRD